MLGMCYEYTSVRNLYKRFNFKHTSSQFKKNPGMAS